MGRAEWTGEERRAQCSRPDRREARTARAGRRRACAWFWLRPAPQAETVHPPYAEIRRPFSGKAKRERAGRSGRSERAGRRRAPARRQQSASRVRSRVIALPFSAPRPGVRGPASPSYRPPHRARRRTFGRAPTTPRIKHSGTRPRSAAKPGGNEPSRQPGGNSARRVGPPVRTGIVAQIEYQQGRDELPGPLDLRLAAGCPQLSGERANPADRDGNADVTAYIVAIWVACSRRA